MIRASVAGFTTGVSFVAGVVVAGVVVQHAADRRAPAAGFRRDGWARARDTR